MGMSCGNGSFVGVGGFWVEVRPLVVSDLKVGNFVGVLEALFNVNGAFRFLVVDCEDEVVCGRRLVRFFVEFCDEQTQKQMTNVIRALQNVEVIASKPPLTSYLCCADLQLAKNYALSICDFSDKAKDNLVDRLVASVAGLDVAVEVTARGDRGAAVGIQNFVYKKIYPKANLSRIVLDQVVSVLDEVAFNRSEKPKRAESTVRGGQKFRDDVWVREVIKDAEAKMRSSLFSCQIRIYADSFEKIQTTKNALPAFMNHFKIFEKQRKQTTIQPLKKPSRHTLRNTLLSRLWYIIPASLVLLLGVFGIFNPTRLTSLQGFGVDFAILASMLCLGLGLFLVFRKRNPIVLSTAELAQIVGLPSAIGKLSVAIGQVPPTRMQLGTQEDTITSPLQQDQSIKQASKQNQRFEPNSALAVGSNRRLVAGEVEEDEDSATNEKV